MLIVWYLVNIILIILGLWFFSVVIASPFLSKKKPSIEEYQPGEEDKIQKIRDNIFNSSAILYSVAGELRPSYYKVFLKYGDETLKSKTIFIIGGPEIAIEDEMFEKYHDEHGNKRDEWWKAHPVLEAAHKGLVRLYLKQDKREENHYFVGISNELLYTEYPHRPMGGNGGEIHHNDQRMCDIYRQRLRNLLKSGRVVMWDGKSDIKLVKQSDFQKQLKEEMIK